MSSYKVLLNQSTPILNLYRYYKIKHIVDICILLFFKGVGRGSQSLIIPFGGVLWFRRTLLDDIYFTSCYEIYRPSWKWQLPAQLFFYKYISSNVYFRHQSSFFTHSLEKKVPFFKGRHNKSRSKKVVGWKNVFHLAP